jgi:hypothetical protein
VRASRAQLFAIAAAAAIAGCDDKKKAEPPVTSVASENTAVAPQPSAVPSPGGLEIAGGPIKPGFNPGLMVAAYGAPAPPSSIKGPIGEVSTGPSSGGGVTDAEAVIARARGRWRRCYSEALKFDPGFDPGKVTVTMQVATDGTVKDAKSTSPPSAFSGCVVGVARSLQFTAPSSERTLSVPLVFSKKD